jgi:hypothetical protein
LTIAAPNEKGNLAVRDILKSGLTYLVAGLMNEGQL